MTCPYCNQEHPDNTKFCPETGEKIERMKMCSNCNEIVPEEAVYCSNCGSRVGFSDLIVDLGLSVKWSICNFGSENPGTPEENKSLCARFLNSGVYEVWGAHWRMPTLQEFEELIEKCTFTPSNVNGIQGLTVKGPNKNTMFMPATYRPDREEKYQWMGIYGTCSPIKDNPENFFVFAFVPKTGEMLTTDISREIAIMIRPVFDELHAYLDEGISFGDDTMYNCIYDVN